MSINVKSEKEFDSLDLQASQNQMLTRHCYLRVTGTNKNSFEPYRIQAFLWQIHNHPKGALAVDNWNIFIYYAMKKKYKYIYKALRKKTKRIPDTSCMFNKQRVRSSSNHKRK